MPKSHIFAYLIGTCVQHFFLALRDPRNDQFRKALFLIKEKNLC